MGFIKSLYNNSSLNENVKAEMNSLDILTNAQGKYSYSFKHSYNLSSTDLNKKVDEIFEKHYSNTFSLFKSYRKSAIKSSIKQYISEGKTTEITKILQQFKDEFKGGNVSDEEIKTFAQNYPTQFLSVEEIIDIVKNNQRITAILIHNNIISINKRTGHLELQTDKISRAKNTMKEIKGDIYLAKHLEDYSRLNLDDKRSKYERYHHYRRYLETSDQAYKKNHDDYIKKFKKEYEPLFADFYDKKITPSQLDDAFKASFERKFSKSASPFLQKISVDSETRELINHGEFLYKTLKSISKYVETSSLEGRRVTLDGINRIVNSDAEAEKALGKRLTNAQKEILSQFTQIFDEQFINETHLYCKLKKPKSDSIINLIEKHFFNDRSPKRTPKPQQVSNKGVPSGNYYNHYTVLEQNRLNGNYDGAYVDDSANLNYNGY